MKKIIVMFLVINLSVPFSLFALAGDKSCECGSHATGIYTFTVVGGTNVTCCNGTIAPESTGVKRTYKQSGGAWELDETIYIAGSTAQSECCNNS